jgi:hypothetical protein
MLLIGLLLAVAFASPIAAQAPRSDMPSDRSLLAANLALGGLTAGVSRLLVGDSFWSAFAKGAGGGALAFAGKKIISHEGTANAWAGRQIAAIGASQVRNVSAGRGMLSELTLPLGPSRINVSIGNAVKVTPKIDLAAVIVAAVTASRSDTWLDMRQSLATGAIVFTQPLATIDNPGSQTAGVLRIDDIPPHRVRSDRVFVRPAVTAHELVHASQYDFASIAWAIPLEKRIVAKHPAALRVNKYVDFGILVPIWLSANALIHHDARPWEKEAISLAPGG